MNQTATPTRNHWDDLPTRTAATLAFAGYLRKNPDELAKCKENGDYTKRTFANGYFYLEGERQDDPNHPLRPIPMETVFRVYEFAPPPPRDKLVTLVLPDPELTLDEVKAQDVWLCSWPIWLTLTGE
jgi:hypothetical protein